LSPIQKIVDAISNQGFIVIADFLPVTLSQALFTQVCTIDESAFKKAGVGRADAFQVNNSIRTDQIYWLDNENTLNESISAYLSWMETLRLQFNENLFLGLFDYECHYAFYPHGAFYQKHVDAFQGKSSRKLSTVLYLNPDWTHGDGGELILYDENSDDVIKTVEPTFGKMVIFLSEVFPHEVLISQKERFSLTGWFRVNSNLS